MEYEFNSQATLGNLTEFFVEIVGKWENGELVAEAETVGAETLIISALLWLAANISIGNKKHGVTMRGLWKLLCKQLWGEMLKIEQERAADSGGERGTN